MSLHLKKFKRITKEFYIFYVSEIGHLKLEYYILWQAI
jgi:hypothetical protein